MKFQLTGLVAATHTPFHTDGSLNLPIVASQAAHLQRTGVSTAFIGGTTGESSSLTFEERRQLTQRWMEVTAGTPLKVVVHVGSNCVADSTALAAQAGQLGAAAIATLAPSYFKPRTLGLLIDCCAAIAGAAPRTPFYFYDIPTFTGVQFAMPDFLAQAAERIPTLVGLKFTNADLMSYQLCRHASRGKFDILWGLDEVLLAAVSLGCTGAVGSSYNFAAPIYNRLLKAAAAGDFATARTEQFRSVQLIQLLAGYGYMAAAKATMTMLGVDVGPARLPNANLTADQIATLRKDLKKLGFFDWVKC